MSSHEKKSLKPRLISASKSSENRPGQPTALQKNILSVPRRSATPAKVPKTEVKPPPKVDAEASSQSFIKVSIKKKSTIQKRVVTKEEMKDERAALPNEMFIEYHSSEEQEDTGKGLCDTIANCCTEMELSYLDEDPAYYMRNRELTHQEFRHALDVYTNNQDYYLDIKDYNALVGLEYWFLHVIEPVPLEQDYTQYLEWLQRELFKRDGCSYSCCKKAKKQIFLSRKELASCFQDTETTLALFFYLKRKNKWKG